MLVVVFVLQMHIPMMNKKASNSENAVRDKPQPGKTTGIEGDNTKKEHLEYSGDMEPPTEGEFNMFLSTVCLYSCSYLNRHSPKWIDVFKTTLTN